MPKNRAPFKPLQYFAAGDVANDKFRQAVVAAGQGCRLECLREHKITHHHFTPKRTSAIAKSSKTADEYEANLVSEDTFSEASFQIILETEDQDLALAEVMINEVNSASGLARTAKSQYS